MKKKIYILYTSFLCAVTALPQQAFISVPVADLVSSPLYSHPSFKNYQKPYDHVPLCPKNLYSSHICPRLHQLLFNERVKIIETTLHEVKIQICSAFYLINKKQCTVYWTDKKNITLFNELQQNNIPNQVIPNALSFYKQLQNDAHIITLKQPFFCKRLNVLFSAGTRFVYHQAHQDHYNVYAYDALKKIVQKIALPKNCCCPMTTNAQQQRTLFTQLLRQWAQSTQGCIPYTWGGSSFTTYAQAPFTEKQRTYNNKQERYYAIDTYLPKQIQTGFDCAGLVLRAAQSAGIPYFYKNTATLAQKLPVLQKRDTLQNGDLIWVPGHVMVVSDVAHNLLIEARFYEHGYGKVHEIALHKVFDGIDTYQDLITAFHNKQPLTRLDKNGKKRETFKQIKLLKLMQE